uniref:Phosphoribulokinase/uridine kinase domain-containing protein n=1 Tax=Pyramimonas obovata TaxID=1411642 RepID=A0A7S0QW87_9CHLO|mmetsp:Transcript_13862/g.29601  ORF Transcript_13862/g.29601 Transcript_13862/m.29601 type:complete len:337 (+) Transcript_13862:88-1098(+)
MAGSDISFALEDVIASGPLASKLGLSRDKVTSNLAWWKEMGDVLCAHLQMDPKDLTDAAKRRIYNYYLPVYYWVEKTLKTHKGATKDAAPLVIGISAPQGCGKTTLVTSLEVLTKHQGINAATVSIDDFYLTYEDQTALAAANSDNGLLQYRGNAGSHDLKLGTKTLEELTALRDPGATAAVPRYDKSAYQGRGDRAPVSDWPRVEGPLDLVLFEGWMSGFAPLAPAEAAAVEPQLAPVNAALGEYKEAWDRFCDAWLVVQVEDYNWVQKWRLQAEVAMREKGLPCMTDAQVQDFVDRFLPAYKAYLPGLYRDGPTTSAGKPYLGIQVDANRNVRG